MEQAGSIFVSFTPAITDTASEVIRQVIPQVTPQVIRLLNALEEGELNRGLLMEKLGLHDRKSFGKNYLRPALEQNLIEMTQADSPKSPTQKYRLTEKGKAMLDTTKK